MESDKIKEIVAQIVPTYQYKKEASGQKKVAHN